VGGRGTDGELGRREGGSSEDRGEEAATVKIRRKFVPGEGSRSFSVVYRDPGGRKTYNQTEGEGGRESMKIQGGTAIHLFVFKSCPYFGRNLGLKRGNLREGAGVLKNQRQIWTKDLKLSTR